MDSMIRCLKQIQKVCKALRIATALGPLFLLFAGSPGACLPQGQIQQYNVTNLGFVAGNSLNDTGQIAGGFSVGPLGVHPFIWDATNGVRDLGVPPGFASASATGMNNQGHVVGLTIPAPSQSFYWDSARGFLVPGLPNGGGGLAAPAISDTELIATDLITSSSASAAVWAPASSVQPLTSPCPGQPSYESAISRNGMFVAGSAFVPDCTPPVGDVNSANFSGVVWHSGTWTALPGFNANAADVNDAGQVAGTTCPGTVGTIMCHAVIWTNSILQDLGTLPGDQYSEALGINDSGQVVGSSTSTGGHPRPFVWDSKNGMQDLNSLIPSGSGIVLYRALRINNAGQILASGSGPVGYTFLLSPGQLSAPTNLSAKQSSFSANGVQLAWNYGSNASDSFSVERIPASANNDWSQAVVIPVSSLTACPLPPVAGTLPCSYQDQDAALGNLATFLYRVRANEGSTPSDFSNTATAYQLKEVTPYSISGTSSPVIKVDFIPDPAATSLSDAAKELGYDHFNWIQYVVHDPQCYIDNPDVQLHAYPTSSPVVTFPQNKGAAQIAPHLDPPPGGYVEYGQFWFNGQPFYGSCPVGTCEGPFDELPYVWNENPTPRVTPQPWYLEPVYGLNPYYDLLQHVDNAAKSLNFGDLPKQPCLYPGSPYYVDAGYAGFNTILVGIGAQIGAVNQPLNSMGLAAFSWNSTYNGKAGSINGVALSSLEPPVIPGTGGIFNVAPVALGDLPVQIRQMLIELGVQGVTTAPKVDKDAPMTAAFLAGQQGTNGWYTSPVTVTLIATDIDGPSDIAATSYTVDGSSLTAYVGPFTISVDGVHTIQFSSIDLAGNAETLKSVTFKIDATPPSITSARSPAANATGWNNSPVTVSFQCADTLSGLAAGSPPAPTVLSGEGAAQSVSGTCTDVAGNSATSTVNRINIDKTPPVITASTKPATLWPPNGKMVSVTVSGTMSDNLSGVNSSTAAFAVRDSYGLVQPTGPVSVASSGAYSFTISLEARRAGQDKNGRLYTIVVSAQDNAGNASSATTMVIVPHDQGN
jgi:probable HAF family extracellular repeat protein